MAAPDQHEVHNYAYGPSVENWVQSTSLAQFDRNAGDHPSDDPDAFYRPQPYHPGDPESAPYANDMTTTRQRQQTPNGAARTTPKPSTRSVSGPASSTLSASRSTPQLPGSRPSVRALTQKFDQAPSSESSPQTSRVRSSRPSASPRSSVTAQPASSTSSPARPAREASYGTYKFNNLKPRERPQPAPASPASARRMNGRRPSADGQTPPSKRKLSSPTRSQKQVSTPVRQPFFGEVVGEHDTVTPGFGITPRDPESSLSPTAEEPSIGTVSHESHLQPQPLFSGNAPLRHDRSPSDMTETSATAIHTTLQTDAGHTREPRRHSPPSRIPVATRRKSIASDSGSSTRSTKGGSARPVGTYSRRSPVRTTRKPVAGENLPSKDARGSPLQTLPAVSYRQYHSRAKSPVKGATNGASLTAVINAPQPPASPRLRHSRERSLAAPNSPESRSRSLGQHDRHEDESQPLPETSAYQLEDVHELPSVALPLNQQQGPIADVDGASHREPAEAPEEHHPPPDAPVESHSTGHQAPLTLHTSLSIPQQPEPLSAATSFEYEESPVLGMPGSFMMTPPIAQNPTSTSPAGAESEPQFPVLTTEPEGELLQPRTFQPSTRTQPSERPFSELPLDAPSELGLRESIPIMLGADEPLSGWSSGHARSRASPRINIGAQKWRTQPLDASGTISYLEEDDSPIDPFANRESLRPDDSASVAFYRPRISTLPEHGGLTLDSEAYSVINKVLNMYHESSVITPEVAEESRSQIQSVSPVIAQHKDWGSKEATETYLARLLSDANASGDPNEENTPPAAEEISNVSSSRMPSLSLPGLDDEAEEQEYGGTAIIFPPVSRRYSRGSRGSSNTNSWGDGSRADSSSALSRDHTLGAFSVRSPSQPPTYAPQPPPKDSLYRKGAHPSSRAGETRPEVRESIAAGFEPVLPEIQSTGEGLGLSLQSPQTQHHAQPPRPLYSPPPPPTSVPPPQAAAPYTPSVYQPHPPSSVLPQAPLPHRGDDMAGSIFSNLRPHRYDRSGEEGQRLIAEADEFRRASMASTPRERSDSSVNHGDEHAFHDFAPPEPAHEPSGSSPDPAQTNGAEPEGLSQPDDVDGIETDARGRMRTTTTKPGYDRGQDPKFLQRKKGYRVIYELIATEKHFADDMAVVGRLFYDSAVDNDILSETERRTLFANSPELQLFSYRFWDSLRKSIRPILQQKPRPPKPKDEADETAQLTTGDPLYETAPPLATQPYPWDEFEYLTAGNYSRITIGRCIVKHLPQLERLYTTYLLNHGEANNFLQSKLKAGDWKLLGWQKACMDHSKGMTLAWDLDSLLVKPVQRLLKYPLMLDELIKVLPEGHPDLPDLEAARKSIIEMSVRINSSKTRQETLRNVIQPKKEKDKSKGLLENRLGKNITKALFTKNEKPKPMVEDESVFNDKEYKAQAQKFGGHFFQVQVVIRDIEKYLETIQGFSLQLNIIVQGFMGMIEEQMSSSHPEIASHWSRMARAMLDLHRVILEDHRNAIKVKIVKPITELWRLYVRPQRLMEQRKKGLGSYIKYKQALDRKEKIDPKLQDAADTFKAVNDALRDELPMLYDKTRRLIIACLKSLVIYQKDWWKNAQKMLLPLLETEPQYTTSFHYDLKSYQDRFLSDYMAVQTPVLRLGIVNHSLLEECANIISSPLTNSSAASASDSAKPSVDEGSRKSSSRRTESIGSEISNHEDIRDARMRRSGGYDTTRANLPGSSSGGFSTSWRNFPHSRDLGPHKHTPETQEFPRTSSSSQPSPSAPASNMHFYQAQYLPSTAPNLQAHRATSPESDDSDDSTKTVTPATFKNHKFSSLDGAFDDDFVSPAMQDSQFLVPTHQAYAFNNTSASSSQRASGVFNSALPMSDSPTNMKSTSSFDGEDEPEVLFLAASLFEFNIAHDRREGGIPYLVYVPGEIFDVIGMKGELWLARNQDDPVKTVGWIWEKHFARILPDES
ncbi:hypothetical protein BDV96DRAFT_580599 [Lophiotrema nucula]|uniref:DH domain-containing protein n=1 Tax=Lophiotrema nucula TaxID=690887 RepID=A0A6A5Z0J4_9PLEO|nr:hypothetical protein BDV96DRAFT_580599 [Lophiotrema nucula]